MSKFKTEVIVPVSKLKEWLVSEGYLPNKFTEAKLDDVILSKYEALEELGYIAV